MSEQRKNLLLRGEVETGLYDMLQEKNAEIERLRERCEAYKGQVKAGADEIASLRERAAEMQYEAGMYHSLYDVSQQQLASARKALEPFAAVAEHDIGADEVDTDVFSPMREPHNRAPRIRVGHLRAAKAALSDDLRRCPTCLSFHKKRCREELRGPGEPPCPDPWHDTELSSALREGEK